MRPRRVMLHRGRGRRLATQAKALDQRLVPLEVLPFQVSEQAAALVDHFQETPARMVILAMVGEMLAEVLDARGQQRNLDLRRAGVVRATTEVGNDPGCLFDGKRHDWVPFDGTSGAGQPPGETRSALVGVLGKAAYCNGFT